MKKEMTNLVISMLEQETWIPRWNELKRKLIIEEDLPWRSYSVSSDWLESDWERAFGYFWLKCKDNRMTKKGLRECIEFNARKNKFHPILTSLEEIEVPEESVLETLLSDFLGAEGSDLNKAILEYVLVNAYRRMKGEKSQFYFNMALIGDSPDTVTAFLDALSLGNSWKLRSNTNPNHMEYTKNVFVEFRKRPNGTKKANVYNRGKEYPKTCSYIRNSRFLELLSLNPTDADLRDWPIEYDVSESKRPIEELTSELALTVWKAIEDTAKNYDDKSVVEWILERIKPKKQQLIRRSQYKRTSKAL